LELKDIKAVIDLMRKNDLSVFEMEKDGFRLKLQKGSGELPPFSAPAPAPAAPPSPATAAPAAAEPEPEKGGAALKDIVSPPFADVGKAVTEDTLVCIIEAMKVMNEIKAETKGVIAEVVAENGKPVQFGQVLFRVK
jgi:acetyl-CoA carboxylase biotin carboxyl carrier protein